MAKTDFCEQQLGCWRQQAEVEIINKLNCWAVTASNKKEEAKKKLSKKVSAATKPKQENVGSIKQAIN